MRILWWNYDEIAPGVWRTNQPSPARLRKLKERGLRSVINLRGKSKQSHYLFEAEACEALDLDLHNVTLSARRLPPRKMLKKLLRKMKKAQQPVLLHCKSGSDRAGFAAALYLAIVAGQPIGRARKQLHWRYLHLSTTDTGILDHVFDVYEADDAATGIDLESWIKTRYNPVELTRSWEAKRAA